VGCLVVACSPPLLSALYTDTHPPPLPPTPIPHPPPEHPPPPPPPPHPPQDLIQRLLERKPTKRLGMLSGKAGDVMRHRWFEGVDWGALAAKRVAPPRKPRVRVILFWGWE
jgi:serine/threonine protein kinase